MVKRDYLYYYDRWFMGVRAWLDIVYEDPSSVRKANRGSDTWRKAAADIGEYYPEKIPHFAELLNHEEEAIRVHAAVSVLRYMPHTKDELKRSIAIIQNRMATCTPSMRMVWEWNLNQPWASEESCTEEREMKAKEEC